MTIQNRIYQSQIQGLQEDMEAANKVTEARDKRWKGDPLEWIPDQPISIPQWEEILDYWREVWRQVSPQRPANPQNPNPHGTRPTYTPGYPDQPSSPLVPKN